MRLPDLGVVMVAITKNEGPFIAEWVAYHYLLGVEHFVIYDNRSADGTFEVLAPFVNAGLVTLVHWPLFPGQIDAYQHAVTTFGPRCDWMGFLDIDEFVSLPPGMTLPAFLAGFPPEAEEVVLFWRMFGHSGYRARPAGLVIQNFVQCDPNLWQIAKCFVRPERVRTMFVHHAETINRRSVDEKGRPIPQVWMHERGAVTGDIAVINHYFTRSYEDYATKIARGQADGRNEKKLEPFEKWDFDHTDTRAADHAPALQDLMDLVAERGVAPSRYGCLSRMGVIGSTRNFMTASQAAVNAMKKYVEAAGHAVKLQHSLFGTALVITDRATTLLHAGLDPLCLDMPKRAELHLPAEERAITQAEGDTLVPARIFGSVWIGVELEVLAHGYVDIHLTGDRRDGTRLRQKRRQALPNVGRVLALMVINDEPVVPLAVDLHPSDPQAVTVRAIRVFGCD
ncbi:glycosyltransferase family 92 protein [Paracoccus yeei]|nr:glycosyltransferase family 92 protein [Paracoccus yeei]